MNKTLAFAITIILLSCSILRTEEKSPSIKFEELDYDFGKVEEGPTLEHIFKFRNDGESVLIINSVHAGCGCTGVIMDEKKEFQPGEEGEIKITFNTPGRIGINKKSVFVYTNDAANKQVTLSFTCEIKKLK